MFTLRGSISSHLVETKPVLAMLLLLTLERL